MKKGIDGSVKYSCGTKVLEMPHEIAVKLFV